MKRILIVMLVVLSSLSFSAVATTAQGQGGIYQMAVPGNGGNFSWSSPMYRPERGDRIIRVNGSRIDDVSDFYSEVKSSPTMIYLDFIDHRTGSVYTMRTRLNPPYVQSRLGIYVEEYNYGRGVVVTGFLSGYPGLRCQKQNFYSNGYDD